MNIAMIFDPSRIGARRLGSMYQQGEACRKMLSMARCQITTEFWSRVGQDRLTPGRATRKSAPSHAARNGGA